MASRAESRIAARHADAEALRAAADVLLYRARKRTFTLLMLVRVLRRAADRIEGGHGQEVA